MTEAIEKRDDLIEQDYRAGVPASKLATRNSISIDRVHRILRYRKVPIRTRGRQTGWRKLTETEIAHRREVGLKVTTWAAYREALDLPETYNVRLDRRPEIGVRLGCFICPKSGRNPSTTTLRVDGVIRSVCDSCAKARATDG